LTQPRFCDQCGAPLEAHARFCQQCGQALPVPQGASQDAHPAAAAPAAAAGGEPVVGVIATVARRKGLFGSQTYCLVVTPQRLVFAELTSQMQKDAARRADEAAKAEGKGLLGRVAARFGWTGDMRDKYEQMPVEDALREVEGNFFVPNSGVRKVTFAQNHNHETHVTTEILSIEADSGKYRFELRGDGIDRSRDLLRQTLGVVVR